MSCWDLQSLCTDNRIRTRVLISRAAWKQRVGCFALFLFNILGFPGGSVVKNLPAMQETWVQSLGQEDPLEKGMATHASLLAWRIPWTDDPGGLYSPRGCQESDTTEWLTLFNLYTLPLSYLINNCTHTHTHTHTHTPLI